MAGTFFLREFTAICALGAVALAGTVPAAAGAAKLRLLEKDPGSLSVDEIIELVQALESGWQQSVEFATGFGWDSNLLLSSLTKEESAFWRASVEGLWRRPAAGQRQLEWIGYLSATHRRMFDRRHLPDDTEAFLHGEARWQTSPSLRIAAVMQAYYLDTVLDLSTESDKLALPLTTAGLVGGATAHWDATSGMWLEAGATVNRSDFRVIPEDSMERRVMMRFGWQSREGSWKFSASVRDRQRRYADRNSTAIGGRPLAGTRLRFRLPECEVRLEKHLDWHGSWGLAVGAQTGRNDDNGTGFFDYRLDKLVVGVEWNRAAWGVELSGEASRYRWDVQVAGIGLDPPRRRRLDRELTLRMRRDVDERLFTFLEARRECVSSNDPTAGYNVTVASAGIGWKL